METGGAERAVGLDDDHDVVGAVGEGLDLVAPVAALVLAKVGRRDRREGQREGPPAHAEEQHYANFWQK